MLGSLYLSYAVPGGFRGRGELVCATAFRS